MSKIKRVRTIDAVVMGWRPGKEEGTVGSLILGLHDEDGTLRTVGHTSGISAKEKRALPARLKPYETGERGMGDPSRWDNARDLEWVELRPELVVEVTFDHASGGRRRAGVGSRPRRQSGRRRSSGARTERAAARGGTDDPIAAACDHDMLDRPRGHCTPS